MNIFFIFSAKYLYLLSIIIAVSFFIFNYKKSRKEIAIFTIFTLAFSYIFGNLGRLIFYDPRPFVIEHFTPMIAHIADNGFPSDHTLLTSAIAASIIPYSKTLGIILFVIALIVGFSRIYVGIHSPIDIAGSIIFAIAGGLAAKIITKKFSTR